MRTAASQALAAHHKAEQQKAEAERQTAQKAEAEQRGVAGPVSAADQPEVFMRWLRLDMLRQTVVTIAVAVIGLTLGFGCTTFRPKPGQAFPSQGREHVAPGQSHPAYNSNPPTSGWHYAQAAPPGAYRQEIPDEILIHNLEHGCVWISYKDPKNTELVEKLGAIAARYPTSVVLAPRPKNDSAIAVAAWQRLLKIETFDQGQIEEFIKAWRNKAPESLNCAG